MRPPRATTTPSGATKLQRQVDVDQHPKAAITVRQAVTHWLDVAEHQDTTTREQYDDLIWLYILPTLGDMRVAEPCTSRLCLARNESSAGLCRRQS